MPTLPAPGHHLRSLARTALLLFVILTPPALAQTELRIAIPGEGNTLDPAHLSYVPSFSVASNIYSGLVRYEVDGLGIVPDLATDWSVSDDGLTWTFELRDGVVWHGGFGELTAQDVVASFQRVMDPTTGSRWSGELDVVASVEAPDEDTVVFTLNEPNAAFLHTVAAFRQGLVTDAEAVAEHGEDFGRNPIGTGPFELQEWVPGTQLVLTANEDYFLGAPSVDRVVFVVIADENVRMLALENGEVDIAMQLQNPEIYARIEANPDIEAGAIATSSAHGIMLNTTLPPFDDVRVRRAMLHAIDRDIIAEVIWGGLAEPAYSDLAPPYLGHTDDVPLYPYDPERAQELLAEAGYPNGFETEMVWLATHSPDLLATLRAMWGAIGVDVDVEGVDGGTWVSRLGEGETPMVLALATRADPHVWYSSFFHGDAASPGLNAMHYAEVDDLIDAGALEFDPEARAEIYADVSRQVMTDVPYLPLYWPMHAHPYWNYVDGWGGRQQFNAWLFPVTLDR